MALGKPAIPTPNGIDLRAIQGAVMAVRQRIEALEASIAALASLGALPSTLASLQAQITALSRTITTISTSTSANDSVYARGAAWVGAGAAVALPTNDVVVTCPIAGSIVSVTVLTGGGIGSCVLDIWKDVYGTYPPTVADTITASAKPTISSGIKYTDTTLTGWTKTVAVGDVLLFHIDSTSVFTSITIILEIQP